MGKFNKKISKKNKPLQLEVVPKDKEEEVQLPESRKSDAVIPKKVNNEKYKKPHEILMKKNNNLNFFRINGSTDNEYWCFVDVE